MIFLSKNNFSDKKLRQLGMKKLADEGVELLKNNEVI